MTKKLTFTGHSDDLFCVYVNGSALDEIDTCGVGKAMYSIENGNEIIIVVGEYASDCWMIGVQQFDEETPIPNWQISLSQNPDCDYSPMLTIVCPDETLVINNR